MAEAAFGSRAPKTSEATSPPAHRTGTLERRPQGEAALRYRALLEGRAPGPRPATVQAAPGAVVQRVVIPVGMLSDNNIATGHNTVGNVQEEQHTVSGTVYLVHFHANNYMVNVRNLTSVTATFNDGAGNVHHITCAIVGGAWRITLNQGPTAEARDLMEAILMGRIDQLRDANGNPF